MKVTAFTKRALRIRRERKRLFAEGYEEVGENGGLLWQLYRGHRIGYVITEVVVGPDGLSLFIKTRDTVTDLARAA